MLEDLDGELLHNRTFLPHRGMKCGFCEDGGLLCMHESDDYLYCPGCEKRYWINSPCKFRSLRNMVKRQEGQIKKLTAQLGFTRAALGEYVRKYPKYKSKRKNLRRKNQ